MTYPMKVLALRMNRKRLAVVTEDTIYLYDISNMNNLQDIQTSPNLHGKRHLRRCWMKLTAWSYMCSFAVV